MLRLVFKTSDTRRLAIRMVVGAAGLEPALPECRRMFTNLTNLTNFYILPKL
ncbi:hypothetical protein N183_38300 [Sinorhizobium sp. Sb3]|nr:hypothetical protein N183_38300 [Sinorhizobium sp. Sb3]